MPAYPIRSERAAERHPLHLLLTAFPLAFFTAAFATDIVYANSANLQWQYFSIWLITAGLVLGGLAIVALLVARWRTRGRRTTGALHGILAVVVWVTAFVNALVHSRDGWTAVVPEGIILSGVVVLLLVIDLAAGTRRQGALA